MRELISLWRSTRMVSLVALCAGLYAAVLIPFKVGVPLIPGITEVRPGNVVPIVCSLLFGPAAAWGAAFGNLIADLLGGTFGPGSAFGFPANFLYGYIPYRAWQSLPGRKTAPEVDSSARGWAGRVIAVSLLASLTCALIVGWGVSVLRLFPFGPVAVIVGANNLLVSAVLGPPLLAALHPRVRRWGLLYHQIMGPDEIARARWAGVVHWLLWIAVVAGMIAGCVISFGLHKVPIVGDAAKIAPMAGESGIALGLLPAIVLVLVACALL